MGKTSEAVGTILGGFLIIAPVLWLVVAGGISIGTAFPRNLEWEPEFNREVHGHVVNAYYGDTPEIVIEELKLARQGMHDLGLEAGDYCDARPWKKTPNCDMAWQYRSIDSTIARAEDVRRWRDQQQGSSDQLGDVYGEKMRDVRTFIKEDGWIDDVAHGAFYVENHPFYAAWWDFMGLNTLIFLGATVVCEAVGWPLFIFVGRND